MVHNIQGSVARGRPGLAAKDWTKGSIIHNLWSLSWPMIVTNSLNVLGPTFDMIWAGKLGDVDIAAASVAGIVVMLVNALVMGLFTGLRSMIARSIGSQDREGAINIARQGFFVAGVYSIILAAIGIFFAEPILGLLGISSDVIAIGAPYLRIQFIGMAAMTFRTLSDSTMQASGDTMTPMKIAVVFRVVHLAMSPFLVFGWSFLPRLGINGAAIANVIAQSLGTIIGMWILTSGRSRLRLNFRGFRINSPIIWRLNRIGIPASVMSLQMQFGQVFLMRFVAPFGTVSVAAHGLCQRIDMIMFMPIMGLGLSSAVLVGQNLGAHQPQRAEKNGWIAFSLAEGLMLVCALGLFIWAEGVVKIFSSDPELIGVASTYLRIAAAGYTVTSFSGVLQQSISGSGDTIPPMIISIITIWALQVPLAYALSHTDLQVYGVRWAMVAGSVSGAIAYAIYFRLGRWKRQRV